MWIKKEPDEKKPEEPKSELSPSERRRKAMYDHADAAEMMRRRDQGEA